MNNDFKIFQVRIPNFLALALMAPEILGFLSVYQRLKMTSQEILGINTTVGKEVRLGSPANYQMTQAMGKVRQRGAHHSPLRDVVSMQIHRLGFGPSPLVSHGSSAPRG